MAINENLKELLKSLEALPHQLDDLSNRFEGNEDVLEAWAKKLKNQGKNIDYIYKALSAAGKSVSFFSDNIHVLSIEVDKLDRIQRKNFKTSQEYKDAVKAQNDVVNKLKAEITSLATISKKKYESEQKIRSELEMYTKSLNENMSAISHSCEKTKNLIVPAAKLIGIFSATSMSVGTLKEKFTDYNKSMVSFQRAQQIAGNSTMITDDSLDKLSKSTVMSKQQFLNFSRVMTSAYLGIKPTNDEMSNFAKNLESKFGPDVELITSKMQTLMGVQNRFPQIYKDMLDAQNKLSNGEREGAKVLQNSILARSRAAGLSRDEIDTLIQATTEMTPAQKRLFEANEASAKASRDWENAVLSAGKTAEKVFVYAADLARAIIAAGVAFSAFSGAIVLKNGIDAVVDLYGKLKNLGNQYQVNKTIAISSNEKLIAAEKEANAAQIASSQAKKASEIASIKASEMEKIASEAKQKAATLTTKATIDAKRVAEIEYGIAAKNAKEIAVNASNAETIANEKTAAAIEAKKSAASSASKGFLANAGKYLLGASAIIGMWELGYGVGSKLREVSQDLFGLDTDNEQRDRIENLNKLNEANKKNLEITSAMSEVALKNGGKQFKEELNNATKIIREKYKGGDLGKRELEIQKATREISKKYGAEIGKNNEVINHGNMALYTAGEELSVINNNYKAQMELVTSVNDQLSKQISLSNELGVVSDTILKANVSGQERALALSEDYIRNLKSNVSKQLSIISLDLQKANLPALNIDFDIGETDFEKATNSVKSIEQEISTLNKRKKEGFNVESQIASLQTIGLTVGKELNKISEAQVNVIKARRDASLKELEVDMHFNSVYENRINTQRELMESAQFGFGSSIKMMQEQVNQQYKQIEAIEKTKEKLEETNKIFGTSVISQEELNSLKTAQSEWDAKIIAQQIASTKNANDRALIESGLINYARDYNKQTDDQMQKQKKIYDLTKNIREGYLSAIRAMSSGAGKFSKTIATQEVGTSELMKRVKDVTGQWKLNTMALGQMHTVNSEAYEASLKTAGQYTSEGLTINRSDSQQNAQNKGLYNWQQSLDQFNALSQGKGGAPVLGSGAAAGQSENIQRQVQAIRDNGGKQDVTNQKMDAQTNALNSIDKNINESVRNGTTVSEKVNKNYESALNMWSVAINEKDIPPPSQPVPQPPSSGKSQIPPVPTIPSSIIKGDALKVVVVGGSVNVNNIEKNNSESSAAANKVSSGAAGTGMTITPTNNNASSVNIFEKQKTQTVNPNSSGYSGVFMQASGGGITEEIQKKSEKIQKLTKEYEEAKGNGDKESMRRIKEEGDKIVRGYQQPSTAPTAQTTPTAKSAHTQTTIPPTTPTTPATPAQSQNIYAEDLKNDILKAAKEKDRFESETRELNKQILDIDNEEISLKKDIEKREQDKKLSSRKNKLASNPVDAISNLFGFNDKDQDKINEIKDKLNKNAEQKKKLYELSLDKQNAEMKMTENISEMKNKLNNITPSKKQDNNDLTTQTVQMTQNKNIPDYSQDTSFERVTRQSKGKQHHKLIRKQPQTMASKVAKEFNKLSNRDAVINNDLTERRIYNITEQDRLDELTPEEKSAYLFGSDSHTTGNGKSKNNEKWMKAQSEKTARNDYEHAYSLTKQDRLNELTPEEKDYLSNVEEAEKVNKKSISGNAVRPPLPVPSAAPVPPAPASITNMSASLASPGNQTAYNGGSSLLGNKTEIIIRLSPEIQGIIEQAGETSVALKQYA